MKFTWVDAVLPAVVAIVIDGIKHTPHIPLARRKQILYLWLLRCVARSKIKVNFVCIENFGSYGL